MHSQGRSPNSQADVEAEQANRLRSRPNGQIGQVGQVAAHLAAGAPMSAQTARALQRSVGNAGMNAVSDRLQGGARPTATGPEPTRERIERAAQSDAARTRTGGAPSRQNRPATGARTGERPVIQRAVGAEVEESQWGVVDAAGGPVPKGTPLVHRPYFQLQAEYAGAGRSSLEMVSNPPGALTRAEWNTMRAGMQKLRDELLARQNKPEIRTASLVGGVDGFRLVPHKLFSPSLQVTVGVPLAAVPALFASLKEVGATVSNQGSYVPSAPAQEVVQKGLGLSAAPSGELLGFITMLDHYLRQGTGTGKMIFLKGLYPVMARTDFAAMFTMLPDTERKSIKENMDAWVQLLAEHAKTGDPTGEGRLVGGWIDDPEDPTRAMEITTTRKQWLTEMASGRDVLTAHGKLGPDAEGLSDAEKASRLAVGVRQDVKPKVLGASDGKRPVTEDVAVPTDEGQLKQLLDDLRELYAGMGALKDKTDEVRYDKDKRSKTGEAPSTRAAIVEIRQPGNGVWFKQMDRIYDAVDSAIQGAGGSYTNVLTPHQQRQRQATDNERQAVNRSRGRAGRVLLGIKALVWNTRAKLRSKRK